MAVRRTLKQLKAYNKEKAISKRYKLSPNEKKEWKRLQSKIMRINSRKYKLMYQRKRKN